MGAATLNRRKFLKIAIIGSSGVVCAPLMARSSQPSVWKGDVCAIPEPPVPPGIDTDAIPNYRFIMEHRDGRWFNRENVAPRGTGMRPYGKYGNSHYELWWKPLPLSTKHGGMRYATGEELDTLTRRYCQGDD